jgi:hypothetical protein
VSIPHGARYAPKKPDSEFMRVDLTMSEERGREAKGVMRLFPDPVLLVWDESIPWCDAEGQKDYETLLHVARRMAVRNVPLGAALFAAGFWLIGRIPGGGGPISYRWQLTFAGPLLLLCLLPYVALQLGFAKPRRGTCRHVRFHLRGIQLVWANGTVKQIGWCRFDAFDFGRWNGFDVLKLRLYGSWPSRNFGRSVTALEFGAAHVSTFSIRDALLDRGLHEEPLGDPGS